MNTAQRIHAKAVSLQAERGEAQELAVKIESVNCLERVFHFHDGSRLAYTAEGFKVL